MNLLTLGVVRWIANFHHCCWLMLQKNCCNSRMNETRKTNNSECSPPLLMFFHSFCRMQIATCTSSSAMQIKTLRWCYGRDYMQIALIFSDELTPSALNTECFQWLLSESRSFHRLSGSCVVCAFHFSNQQSNYHFLSAVDVWSFNMNCK